MIIAVMTGFITINLLLIGTFCYLHVEKSKKLKLIEQQLKRKTQELQALCRGAIGLGERLSGLEREMIKHVNQPKEMAVPVLDGNHYNQARKLFELGASIDDVIRSCHLSKEEAELVALLSNTSTRNQTAVSAASARSVS